MDENQVKDSVQQFSRDICRTIGCQGKYCPRCDVLNGWDSMVRDAIFEDDHRVDDSTELDELDQVELIMAVEEFYDIEIPDEVFDFTDVRWASRTIKQFREIIHNYCREEYAQEE
jgi:acyl carrier protein